MKALRNTFIVFGVLLILVLPSSSGNLNFGITNQLKGRFLIQTDKPDEAWYADPTTGKIHYLGRPDDALALMQQLGLGISNENLQKLEGEGVHLSQPDTELAEQLAGRILLQTEENNQAWYVWPENFQRYFIGQPADAERVFKDLAVGVDPKDFASLQLSDEYYQSLNVLDLAIRAVNAEITGNRDRLVDEALMNGEINRLAERDVTVIAFELSSPLTAEGFGYLARDEYYWRVNGALMRRHQYLASSEYELLEASNDAQAVINEMLQLQTALGFYYQDVNGYPLSQPEGDQIGTPGRMILTNPNGFFGTLRDPIVYDELDLPADLLDLRYFSNGETFALVFRTKADTEFHPEGVYTLTPDELIPGRDLSVIRPQEDCPADFNPVCGANGVTYTNSCLAGNAGITEYEEGAC